ncbi:EamA family transporter [Paenibacillus koleovorans]|uniref:EamA family transporter n=1 Tax=Paenibacillus koleovorans TaxID=121608 RepID=UPI000FDCB835|nr:EamA family transporter [Paenibacillus koleovorans]
MKSVRIGRAAAIVMVLLGAFCCGTLSPLVKLGQVIPTITFNIGIPRIGSSLSAMLASVELPVATVGAWLQLDESIGALQWTGMLLILCGIYV